MYGHRTIAIYRHEVSSALITGGKQNDEHNIKPL